MEVTFDPERAFKDLFVEEMSDLAGRTNTPLEDFRSAGRATKEWPNKQDDAWWLANGPTMVENWVKWRENSGYSVLDINGTPAIELDLKVDFNGTMVRAIVDRVMVSPEGSPGVVDLKSGSREKKTTLQLGIYAMVVKKALDIDIEWGGYWMARKGSINPVPLNLYSPDFWARVVREVRAAKERKQFLPVIGDHCGFCGVAKHCPALTGLIDPELFKENGEPLL